MTSLQLQYNNCNYCATIVVVYLKSFSEKKFKIYLLIRWLAITIRLSSYMYTYYRRSLEETLFQWCPLSALQWYNHHYSSRWLTAFLTLVSELRSDTKEPISPPLYISAHWCTYRGFPKYSQVYKWEIPYSGEHMQYFECNTFFDLSGFQDTNQVGTCSLVNSL